MFSGDSSEEVQATLSDHVARGSSVVTATVKVGRSWVAACTVPSKAFDADRTTTLRLSDLASAPPRRAAPIAPLPESFTPCVVQEHGWKRIITGPTRQDVGNCAALFRERGGQLISDIEQDGEIWIAVVDLAGVSQ
jgi:hypothetical protein